MHIADTEERAGLPPFAPFAAQTLTGANSEHVILSVPIANQVANAWASNPSAQFVAAAIRRRSDTVLR